MSAESLMQMCAELGIKLTLKGDDDNRLQVDAPKGALTAPLRDALAANKPALIAILKKQNQSLPTPASTFEQDSEETKGRSPASNKGNSPEATPLSFEHPFPGSTSPLDRTAGEVDKVSANQFDDAIRRLRTADSPSERAAAARKLGLIHDPKATPHLIASLNDGAPEVRRASTESLGQIGDAVAIAALNELLLRETSRQLPEAVIRHAINSITVTQAKRSSLSEVPMPRVAEPSIVKEETTPRSMGGPLVSKPETPAATTETPAPKREIFADYLRSFEERAPSATPIALPAPAKPSASTRSNLEAAEEQLRQEEEALRRAADALERKRAEAEAARAKAEEQARLKAESEAQVRMEIEARIRAEEEARRRTAEEAARQKDEEEARVKTEQEARSRAEEEALRRAEEEARFRLEAETLRKAAEELARKRSEAETVRRAAEEQARQRIEHEAKLKAEEETVFRAAEEARRQAQEEMRRRVDEEMRRRAEEELRRRAEEEAEARAVEEVRLKAAVEARILAEVDAKRIAQEEEQRLAEKQRLARAVYEADQRVAEERVLRDAEERQRAEEARLRMEQETLMQVAAELSRRRSELEAARHMAESEARLLIEAEERARAEDELRRQRDLERQQLELETKRRAEEELLAELRRRAAEERQLTETARLQVEEEERRLAELELVRAKAEEEALQRAEKEQRIKAEILALTQAEEEQHRRIEAEIRRRNEAEERLKQQQARTEADTQKISEEIRAKAEEQARRVAEFEARLRDEEARLEAEREARTRTEEEAYRLAEETRLKVEEEARRRAEVEARLRDEEIRLQAEREAGARAEEEAHRLAEETRLKAEEEARRRAEVEARLKEEEARLQAEQDARARAEAEARRLAEEIRARAEEESRLRAEAEARLKEEQARLEETRLARSKAEEAVRLAAENRLLSEEEPFRRAETREVFQVGEPGLESNEEDLSTSFNETSKLGAVAPESNLPDLWVDPSLDQTDELPASVPLKDDSSRHQDESPFKAVQVPRDPSKEIEAVFEEKGLISAEDDSGIPSDVLKRLASPEPYEREAALSEVVSVGGDEAFRCITRAFDDQSANVRNAAARALYDLQSDRAASFTRALREGTPERRRKIGQALAGSGLAKEAVGNLTGESREKTYDAFSLLFLMAKAGEVQPLLQAIEDYPNVEVRIAVVKLLALSGQPEVVPAFRRLAVRGSLPSEVRSAVMEAIYQISSQARESTPSAA